MPLDKKQKRQLDDLKRKQQSLTQRLAIARREDDSEGACRQIEEDIRRVESQIDDLLDADEGW